MTNKAPSEADPIETSDYNLTPWANELLSHNFIFLKKLTEIDKFTERTTLSHLDAIFMGQTFNPLSGNPTKWSNT